MGGAVSTGIDNDDLIDNLVDANYIKSGNVERVFRAVDRAEYYLPEHRDTAYRDLAWKHGHLHLSAPCIYSEVMESLRLKAGLSFLNLGSGTGYLSTMVGLMIGPYAVNHGVELHPDVVEYARERLEEFKRHCEVFDEFEFSEPVFVTGNCLLLTADCQRYDRVYCGAACPPEHEDYMKKLINVGGILVMPLNDQLLQITRSSENTWESKNVLPVSFASLVMPSRDTGLDIVELPEVALPCLQDACRVNIRRILKVAVRLEHPPVKRNRLRKPKGKRRRQKRINIVPMSMGMVILGQFDGSDEDAQGRESDEDNGEEVTESEGEEAMDSTASSVSSHQHGSEDHSASPQSLSVRRSSPRSAKLAESQASSLPFPPDMQEKVMDTEGSAECEDSEERAVKVPRSRQTDGDRLGRRSRHQPADSGHDSSSEDSDHGQFDLDIVEMIRRSALATRGPPRKVRCSSSTSADTSETSGICTVSDHSDESIGKPSPETCSPPNLLASLPPPTTSQTLPDRVNSEPNFKFYLKEKISALPIPVALKAYLMYYRN